MATLIRDARCSTYGYVTDVDDADLSVLDRYEGVPRSYGRASLVVETGPRTTEKAIVYIARSREFNPPSRAYLEAIAKTVNAFWRGGGGRITIDDFPIRLCAESCHQAGEKRGARPCRSKQRMIGRQTDAYLETAFGA